jgi:hypothetical protein
MKLEFYQETHYTGTNMYENRIKDGVHVHFDCPSCETHYAGTDMYGNLYEYIENVGDVFYCQECGTCFKLIRGSCWDGEYEEVKELKHVSGNN